MTTTPDVNEDRIVWIDTETTGLYPRSDWMLEIAVIVTDSALNEVASFSEVLHVDLARTLDRMDEYVANMHAGSGLLGELALATEESSGPAVQERIIEFLNRHGAVGAVAAGSNIPFDRGFLDVWMSDLNRNALHYRSIDVSTVKELARRFAPDVFATAPQKRLEHRALADIRESIAELRHYVDAGFISTPPPAPCTAETHSWDHYRSEQIDPYWIHCTLAVPHTEHHDSNTGLTWEEPAALAAEEGTN